jgi:hypothetical protein
MATTAKTAITELQNRLRLGTAEIAVTNANLMSIMNYVQRTLNYALKRDISTGTYTAASTTTVISYTSASIAADCYGIISMYDSVSNESLYRCPNWNALQQADSSWRTQSATKSLVWSHIGRNQLAVYPASSQTYNVVYLRETTTIDSTGDTFTIPDADINLLYDVSELIWLTHLRHYEEAKLKAKALLEHVIVRQTGVRKQ